MPTANEDYWNNFTLSGADVEWLYGFVLEQGAPIPSRVLIEQIVTARLREEEVRRARYSQHATPYQPKLEFEIGQHVIFSELDDAEGVVTAIRPSDNPRLSFFQVAMVQFTDGHTREFAAQYHLPHLLNQDRAATAATTDLMPEQVIAQYGTQIEASLIARLHQEKEFVEQDGQWLLRGLLTPISDYPLNVAEASIEQQNTAHSTTELMQVSELHAENVKKSTLQFSFEYALRHDERFVDVGPRGEARWYLTRLEPEEAREIPKILQLPMPAASQSSLSPELTTLVEELEGAADVNGQVSAQNVLTPIVTLALTYPHRQMGTLPLTSALRALFPETDNARMFITLVDETTGTRFPGWFVGEGNYIAGLKTWYDQRKLNPGAYVQLTKRPEPLTVGIEAQTQRERSLWVRVARVQNGQLTFAQEKKPVAHKYDEEMLIVIGDVAGLDTLHASNRLARSLETLLVEIFPELAKLSGAGRVHAKTLFAAVNFARRAGPRAVFTALASSRAFVSSGGGYFVMETAR